MYPSFKYYVTILKFSILSGYQASQTEEQGKHLQALVTSDERKREASIGYCTYKLPPTPLTARILSLLARPSLDWYCFLANLPVVPLDASLPLPGSFPILHPLHRHGAANEIE